MILRTRNTIAGAVCRAILRAEADPGYRSAEGTAYKCALAERGCNPLQLCEDAHRDYLMMLRLGRSGKGRAITTRLIDDEAATERRDWVLDNPLAPPTTVELESAGQLRLPLFSPSLSTESHS